MRCPCSAIAEPGRGPPGGARGRAVSRDGTDRASAAAGSGPSSVRCGTGQPAKATRLGQSAHRRRRRRRVARGGVEGERRARVAGGRSCGAVARREKKFGRRLSFRCPGHRFSRSRCGFRTSRATPAPVQYMIHLCCRLAEYSSYVNHSRSRMDQTILIMYRS